MSEEKIVVEERESSILGFLADLGEIIIRHCRNKGVAIAIVVLAWIFNTVAALIVTLIVAYIYRSGGVERRLEEIEAKKAFRNGRDWSIALGLALIVVGAYWLIEELITIELPWQVALIVVGAILVILGVKG